MNSPRARLRETRGYSVLELMVVVLLIGILASLATPAMNTWVNRTRTTGALNRINSDVAYARVYAVREARSVWVQIGDDGRYSVDTLNASGVPAPLRSVDLRVDHPELSTQGTTATQLRFNARGLAQGMTGAQYFKVAAGGARDSLFVSPAGRTYRGH